MDQIKQMTIDDILYHHYTPLEQSQAGVYPKIDWLTLMFTDCSIRQVLEYLEQDEDLTNFAESLYSKMGMLETFRLRYNDILIEVGKHYFYGSNRDESFFDIIVPSIRCDISGKGLDYLRSVGWEFYAKRLQGSSLDFHVTRCDWAFDFIDYKPDFLDQMIAHLKSNELASGRVPLISTRGAVKYSLRLGFEKTIYLGSSQSDKMLRCYDKKLQLCDPTTNVWRELVPYPEAESWFRIELQTRNYTAHGLVMPGTDGQIRDYSDILKYIFESYAFADGTVDGNYTKRTATGFWTDLFPWEEVSTKIIQNAKYVQSKSLESKIHDHIVHSCIPNLIPFIHQFGWDYLITCINEYLAVLQNPDDKISCKRYSAFVSKLVALGTPVSDHSMHDRGLWSNCGRFVFTLPKGGLK